MPLRKKAAVAKRSTKATVGKPKPAPKPWAKLSPKLKAKAKAIRAKASTKLAALAQAAGDVGLLPLEDPLGIHGRCRRCSSRSVQVLSRMTPGIAASFPATMTMRRRRAKAQSHRRQVLIES